MRSVFPITRFGIRSNTLSDFDNFFNGFFNDSFYNSKKEGSNIPLANIISSDEGYTIELAVPGFSRSDFNITVDDNVLTISNEISSEISDKNFSSREFSYASFGRSWNLPGDASTESISARYESGILYIDVPTIEKKNTKVKIDVV
jgi:HSP20 family protein|tara:strand:- start:119 stop:556 length:438 start_codon:yes stop_codon:yes gene_type:complete